MDNARGGDCGGKEARAGDALRQGAGPALPEAVCNYLAHTVTGQSIRALARRSGRHASTVSRQVRRCEGLRADPLIDAALRRLGSDLPAAAAGVGRTGNHVKDTIDTAEANNEAADAAAEEARFRREALRVLRRLGAPGSVLAVAEGLEKAVVMRGGTGEGDGAPDAVVTVRLAQDLAVRDWIACNRPGRVARYRITPAGRAALNRLMAEEENRRRGMAEDAGVFAAQHAPAATREIAGGPGGRRRKVRYNSAESPLSMLARRKGRDGKPFLAPELVAAGERLREDFELAQMGPRVAQDWERFLTGGDRGAFADRAGEGGSAAARERVTRALAELGPGLGDVALRCCCFLEGVETAERRMGWSARSGKIVLRIALQRLKRHYDAAYGPHGPLVG